MAETVSQNIKVRELMTRVRAEAERRRDEAQLHNLPINLTLPRFNWQQSWEPKPDGYHINDFLQFHDRDFVVNAYHGILNREPDTKSLCYYLNRLRDGSQSKVEIIGRLRFSPEGRAKRVRVAGLVIPLAAAMLYKTPLVGGFVCMVTGVLRLPLLIKNFSRFEANTMTHAAQYQAALNELSEKTEVALKQLGFQMQTLQANRVNPHDLNELRSHLDDLRSKVAALQNDQTDTEMKIEALGNNKMDAEREEILMELVNRVGVTEGSLLLKADSYEVGQLKDDIAAAMADKVGNHEVTELRTSIAEVWAEKVDNHEVSELRASLAEVWAEKVDNHEVSELRASLAEVRTDKADNQEVALVRDKIETLDRIFEELNARSFATDKKFTHLKRDVILQERRINFILEEARKRLPEPFDSKQLERLDGEHQHRLDALYVNFEDEFRGTREDIKERANCYLPIIREVDAGTKERPILDIGCGRGEWLELLHETGLTAIGVDLNRVLVQQCNDIGLTVFEADALSYLRESADNSYGALTGIHIIEHLPFDSLVALLDECLRVLKPGGVVILETPNPENIIVGACNFYLDPTHLRPLPPSSMAYMLETRGFINLEVLRQNPMSQDMFRKTALSQELRYLWEFFFREQDYAIIGHKP